MNSVKIDITQ